VAKYNRINEVKVVITEVAVVAEEKVVRPLATGF